MMKCGDVKMNMDHTGNNLEVKFRLGTKVEVRSDEEGFQRAWNTAVIVDMIGNDKYLLEYQTLKMEDDTELHKDTVDASNGPCPPYIQHLEHFVLLEEVDAWYNEGWWVGHISCVLNNEWYWVYFGTTNEVVESEHSDLIPFPRMDQWKLSSWY